METLGARVRARRIQLGLSQVELASLVKKAGYEIGQSGISSIESKGDTRPHAMFELATALKVTVEWLLSGTELPDVPELRDANDEYAAAYAREMAKAYGRDMHDRKAKRPLRVALDFGAHKVHYTRAPPETVPHLPQDVPVLQFSPARTQGETIPVGAPAEAFIQGWLDLRRTAGYRFRTLPIADRSDIFCIVNLSYDLVPWRRSGELIYVDPGRRPLQGKHAVVVLKEPGDDRHRDARTVPIIIGQVSFGSTENTVRLAFYNPARTFDVPMAKIKSLWTVIESDELLSEWDLLSF